MSYQFGKYRFKGVLGAGDISHDPSSRSKGSGNESSSGSYHSNSQN